MGEMKKRHFDFVTVSQRTDLIPYKDEKREKERLEKKRKEKEMGREYHLIIINYLDIFLNENNYINLFYF